MQVDDQQSVECPKCRGVLYPRGGEHRARHFFHVGEDAAESCLTASGGESETHARCTALAVAALDAQFPDASHVGAEVPIDVTGTATTPDSRRADALVEFEAENAYFGKGLIIEVQYKHHSKGYKEWERKRKQNQVAEPQYDRIRERNGNKCVRCGTKEDYDDAGEPGERTLLVHHIIPVANGGSGNDDNLALLCPHCHEHAHDERGAGAVINNHSSEFWRWADAGPEAGPGYEPKQGRLSEFL